MMQILPSDTELAVHGIQSSLLIWILLRQEVMSARLKPLMSWWDERAKKGNGK